MTDNIIAEVADVKRSASTEIDLGAKAENIRRHHRNVLIAVADVLEAAMAAGDELIAVKDSDKVKHGEWEYWLGRKCELNARTARRYIQLARARQAIATNRSRATDLTIAGALRLLQKKSESGEKPTSTKSAPKFSSLDWLNLTLDEQRRIVDAIGLQAWLAAIPSSWRSELEDRIDGQRQAAARPDSKFDETVSKLLRLALAQQKSAKNKNTVAPEVASALNTINNLLIKEGRDLHEIVGLRLDRAQTIEKPARAS